MLYKRFLNSMLMTKHSTKEPVRDRLYSNEYKWKECIPLILHVEVLIPCVMVLV